MKFVYVIRSRNHWAMAVAVGTNFKWAYDQALAVVEEEGGEIDIDYAKAQKHCKDHGYVLVGKIEGDNQPFLTRIECVPQNPEPTFLKSFLRKTLDKLIELGYKEA